VRRVVVAMADPFPQVAGGGLASLRDAGLEVAIGVCEAEAKRLNAPYLKLLRTGRPWVIVKWAMTLDGKIATRSGESKWISGEESRRRVHELRGRVDAVIVGRRTVIADDPMLTSRPAGPRVAVRVVLTASGELPERCQLRSTARELPVLIFTAAGNEEKLAGWVADGAEVIGVSAGDNGMIVEALLAELGRRRWTNVLVEGGAAVLGFFRDANAIDEAWVFIAPKLIGGEAAPSPVSGQGVTKIGDALRMTEMAVERIDDDVLIVGRFV
jgi:diaminohydroxyphosphoribosylaminopyrimidine deaminase/5-amino-6-(5-phosphoribosylamino)uracil reductase